ncbi:hypothetical protein [Methylobacterium sp. WL19]|uniref:hypothetical protein n=1 Tax=Methylobacterium sp. WL19 TaxID=2603896 RepID=UPI0011C72DF8|nr:hypothetical protein [Methylobacterium sp. WL19]TXN26869.1 hypothetical protein FV220_13600 [Methylobacterium sp. WL19]
MYGQTKAFETSAGKVHAATRIEAARIAKGISGKEPTFVRGPKISVSLRCEPTGNRKHPDVFYAGTRAAVRRLNIGVA